MHPESHFSHICEGRTPSLEKTCREPLACGLSPEAADGKTVRPLLVFAGRNKMRRLNHLQDSLPLRRDLMVVHDRKIQYEIVHRHQSLRLIFVGPGLQRKLVDKILVGQGKEKAGSFVAL